MSPISNLRENIHTQLFIQDTSNSYQSAYNFCGYYRPSIITVCLLRNSFRRISPKENNQKRLVAVSEEEIKNLFKLHIMNVI